jgi:hypothetical protein
MDDMDEKAMDPMKEDTASSKALYMVAVVFLDFRDMWERQAEPEDMREEQAKKGWFWKIIMFLTVGLW